jgi:hypothetical protein
MSLDHLVKDENLVMLDHMPFQVEKMILGVCHMGLINLLQKEEL